MNDTLEADLATALAQRADALQVDVPDPAGIRTSTPLSSRGRSMRGRSHRPALAVAAAALVAVGGVVLTRGGDAEKVEAVVEPTITTTTAAPATSASPATTTAPLVDNDGPLPLGEPLSFTETTIPELGALAWTYWAGLVGDTFVVAGSETEDGSQSRLVWTVDGATWTSIEVPSGHRVLDVTSVGTDLVVFTYDPATDEGQRWRLGDALEPLELLRDLELPEHPDPPRLWTPTNRPLFFSVDGRVHALVGAVETVDLVELAERAGLIGPEERVCDLVGEGLAYTLSLSASAETDLECLADTDLSAVVLTPETLRISEADFLLFDQWGRDRTFVVRWEEEGPPTVLAELEGLPFHLFVDGATVTASLWGSDDTGDWLATATDPSDWTLTEAPGPVVELGSGVGWSSTVAGGVDDPSVLYRVDASGAIRLGDLPADLETPRIGRWGDGAGAFPVVDTVDLTSGLEQRGVLVSPDGTRWRYGDLTEIAAPGGELATAAIADRLLVYEMTNPTSIWIADVGE